MFFKFCMLQIVFTYQTHYLEEIHREQTSSRCDNSPKKKKDVYAVYSLIWRHSVQNKFSTCKMNNGECFCVNSDVLKYSDAMLDPVCGQKPSQTFPLPWKMAWETFAPQRNCRGGHLFAPSLFLLKFPLKTFILAKVALIKTPFFPHGSCQGPDNVLRDFRICWRRPWAVALEFSTLSHLSGGICPLNNMFGGQMSSHANFKSQMSSHANFKRQMSSHANFKRRANIRGGLCPTLVRSMWKLGVDPWSKTYGLGVNVPGWNFQTFMHIVFRYICIINTGCFRCVPLFL